MDQALSIKVTIADRVYPLKVENSNKEEIVRKAAKLINERMQSYYQKFGKESNKDNMDLLIMVALEYVTKYLEIHNTVTDTGLLHEIKSITNELEDYIKNI